MPEPQKNDVTIPAIQKPAEKPPEKTPEEKKKEEKMGAIIKELEQAFFTVKFYFVAAKEDAKNDAIEKIKSIFSKEEETVRQLVLYMIHENLCQASEMRTMHNFEFFKRKLPTADPGQLRISVYRAMFNYNFAVEGLIELISLLGELEGDDAAKLLTYHFTFFSSVEGDSVHILRNATIAALGKSNSKYALQSLLVYAKNSDNDMLLGRIASALVKWDEKIEGLKLSKKDKDKLKDDIRQIMMLESGNSHYG